MDCSCLPSMHAPPPPPPTPHPYLHIHTHTCTNMYLYTNTDPYTCMHTHLHIRTPQIRLYTYVYIHGGAYTYFIPPSWGRGLSWDHYFFSQNFLKMYLVYGRCRFGILELSLEGLGLLVCSHRIHAVSSRIFTSISKRKKEKLYTVLQGDVSPIHRLTSALPISVDPQCWIISHRLQRTLQTNLVGSLLPTQERGSPEKGNGLAREDSGRVGTGMQVSEALRSLVGRLWFYCPHHVLHGTCFVSLTSSFYS